MAIRITPPPDDRVARALKNPVAYFAEARRRARAEVAEDIAQEYLARNRRRPNGSPRT